MVEVIKPNKAVLEEGVVVMYRNKFWCKLYSDGKTTSYGWGNIDKAIIKNPEFVTKPTDFVYKGSHDTCKIMMGTVVKIKKRISYEIIH